MIEGGFYYLTTLPIMHGLLVNISQRLCHLLTVPLLLSSSFVVKYHTSQS
jgi:hypothetical protein